MKRLLFPFSLCVVGITLTGCLVSHVPREAPAQSDSSTTTAANHVQPPMLNIDFGVWKPNLSLQTGPAAAGREGDFWNVVAVPWNNAHTESGLKFATGEPSPIQVEMINLGGGWSFDGHMGVKAPMLDTFNYPVNNQGGNSQVILHQVPPGKYDVYIYGHGTDPQYYGDYTLTVGNHGYGRKTTLHAGDSGQKPEWVEGSQYVKFTGVEVAAGQKIEILIQPGGQFQGFNPGVFAERLEKAPYFAAEPPRPAGVHWTSEPKPQSWSDRIEITSRPTPGPGGGDGGRGAPRILTDAIICGLQLIRAK